MGSKKENSCTRSTGIDYNGATVCKGKTAGQFIETAIARGPVVRKVDNTCILSLYPVVGSNVYLYPLDSDLSRFYKITKIVRAL